MPLFSGWLIKAALSDAINAIPRGPVKHPRPARKNELERGKWSERSVATARLESDSAIVTHPLLSSKRTRVRSILSALRFRCSLLILLDNYLHPSLSVFSFYSFVPPPHPHCPLSKHSALSPDVVKQGRKRRSEETAEMWRPRGMSDTSAGKKNVAPCPKNSPPGLRERSLARTTSCFSRDASPT